MGLIGTLFGRNARDVGRAVEGVAEVFVENKTKKAAAEHQEHVAAQNQYAVEFTQTPSGIFDRFVNALNRLPRPILALGTVGLFAFAMMDPAAFAVRMRGLAEVPEPLWWLLGAIVSFYFGARELHYARRPKPAPMVQQAAPQQFLRWIRANDQPDDASHSPSEPGYNAALEDWKIQKGR